MRMSAHFGETLRAAGAEVDVVSHQYLLRAGYVRQLGSGIFSYLPLALRAMRKIETIIREEMEALGGQEISMPVVHPAELWKESGRWYQYDAELARFEDRAGRDMVLAMTHEEIVTDLARREIRSYRQLPALLYQIQTKFRDEPRPRAGLLRVREFTMKDSYSLDVDQAGLETQYRAHYRAYFRIFSRAGLPGVIAVKSDTGKMGGTFAHEFMAITPVGEDTIVRCDGCGYAANQQIARFRKPEPRIAAPRPLEKVATPGASTIAALSEMLGEPESAMAKVVFFVAEIETGDGSADYTQSREAVVMALVRGDMDVNETKLANLIAARWLQPAPAERILAIGAEPGYASAVNLSHAGALVVVDDWVARSNDLISGANEAGFHYRHVEPLRDFVDPRVGDIVSVSEGAPCARCGEPLSLLRGVEVGNIFQLGTRFSAVMGATFLDANGRSNPIVMGSYGIGVGRLLACIAETHRDDRGLMLPLAVAPYHLYLVRVGQDDEIIAAADQIDAGLRAAGVEVLHDDRDVSAGVKFADSDLIGLPLRLTVSKRSLQAGGVEIKRRDQTDGAVVPVHEALAAVQSLMTELRQAAESQVLSIDYPAGDE